jgi:AraC-like DNA-binding protein
MLIPGLPDHTQPRVYTDTPRSYRLIDGLIELEPCNSVIHFRSSEFHSKRHAGPLSIRCAFNGQRTYTVQQTDFAVSDGCYLVLNEGQVFSSHIRSETEVESFNINFRPGFAEEVLRSLITSADHLLDAPNEDCGQPVLFFEQLYPHDSILTPDLIKLRITVSQEWATHTWLEERCHDLLEKLLQVHRSIGREIESLPLARGTTRRELYYRLHRARDFMESNLRQPISIAQIAEVACLSPHYFLRMFKQTFQETPHQYLTRRRLETAKSLLVKTDCSITRICLSVGFESLGSFSWLFRRRFGVSPEMYRKHARNPLHPRPFDLDWIRNALKSPS